MRWSCTLVVMLGAWPTGSYTIGGHPVVPRQAQLDGGGSLWAYSTRLGEPAAREGSVKHDILAAQVWPASRVVAYEMQQLLSASRRRQYCGDVGAGAGDEEKSVVCLELGAGSGLISLAAAKLGAHAICSDVDELSPLLVQEAAAKQGLSVTTRFLDVTAKPEEDPLPPADIVVMADIFVSDQVAMGAAARVWEALERGAMAVVAAQGDRSCRESFLRRLRETAPTWADEPTSAALDGGWLVPEFYGDSPLVLRHVEESDVVY